MRAAAISLVLAAAFALPVSAQASDGPVVLELFTSQGCSSCPPADALLGRLKASGGNVLPLGLHVDYWNRLGWRDPFSSAAATARQYAYARSLGDDQVYTPELVVDGAQGVVGSDSAAVEAAIRRARAAQASRPPVALQAVRDGGPLRITVGAGQGQGRVLVLGYDDRHVTPVHSGENDGRELTDFNAVRAIAVAGDWQGAPLTLRLAAPQGEHLAVLLQAASGRILAAQPVS